MSKQDEQMLYERQEEKIRSQSDAFIQFLTKRGLLGDSDIDDETMRSIQQEKNKVRYHNTELLLKQYRNIAWMVECFPGTIAMELDEPFEQLDQLGQFYICHHRCTGMETLDFADITFIFHSSMLPYFHKGGCIYDTW